MNLLPLILCFAGPTAYLAAVAFSYRSVDRGKGQAASAITATAVIALAAPYAAFLIVNGDPDVWDFYRSYAAVPVLLMLAAIAIGGIIERRLRSASDRHRTAHDPKTPAA